MTTTNSTDWRTRGVSVVRAGAIVGAKNGPAGSGRATAFNFAGGGGSETWVGSVTLPPGARTGAHHHGRTEVAVYVVRGNSEIRWGEHLEFRAEIGPGDFAYFTPFVPHQEINLDAEAALEFVVVRSDNEGIVIPLDVEPAETPETVY